MYRLRPRLWADIGVYPAPQSSEPSNQLVVNFGEMFPAACRDDVWREAPVFQHVAVYHRGDLVNN